MPFTTPQCVRAKAFSTGGSRAVSGRGALVHLRKKDRFWEVLGFRGKRVLMKSDRRLSFGKSEIGKQHNFRGCVVLFINGTSLWPFYDINRQYFC